MIYELYSVRDDKAGDFNIPFAAENEIIAVRITGMMANSKSGQIAGYPEDFSLYRIGSFNPKSGQVETVPPVYITACVNLVKRQEVQK
jgi:hypothetical protein